jgi:hypothetical protein
MGLNARAQPQKLTGLDLLATNHGHWAIGGPGEDFNLVVRTNSRRKAG